MERRSGVLRQQALPHDAGCGNGPPLARRPAATRSTPDGCRPGWAGREHPTTSSKATSPRRGSPSATTPSANVTGRYWYHQQTQTPAHAVNDLSVPRRPAGRAQPAHRARVPLNPTQSWRVGTASGDGRGRSMSSSVLSLQLVVCSESVGAASCGEPAAGGAAEVVRGRGRGAACRRCVHDGLAPSCDGCCRRDARPHDEQVALADLVDSGKHLVEVVVDGEVSPGERVGVSDGDAQHGSCDGLVGVGTPAAELVEAPAPNVILVDRCGRVVGDGLGQPDREQSGMHAEDADAESTGFVGEVLGELDDRRPSRPSTTTRAASDGRRPGW